MRAWSGRGAAWVWVVLVLALCAGGEAAAEGACGDGVVQGAEACDDGNAQYHDGCVACAVEEGWVCPKAGGACAPVCGDKLIVSSDDCDAARQRFRFTDEAPGRRCRHGGTKVEAGFDDNGNDALDTPEVVHVSYACNPPEASQEPASGP